MFQKNYNQPLFSVITVCFNCLELLKITVDSVINQTVFCKNVEYIIVDGNSTDDTLSYLKNLADKYSNIKFISESDSGIYDAMNKGLLIATGQYVNFLNCGDFYYNYNILDCVGKSIIGDVNHVDLVYGDIYVYNDSIKSLVKSSKCPILDIHKGMCICHQVMFVKTEKYPKHKNIKYKAEWVALNTILKSNSFKYIDLPLVYYQLGGKGEINWFDNFKEFFQEYRSEYGVIKTYLNTANFLKILIRMTYKSIRKKIAK